MMKSFMIGCNYWASNAGVYMWRNFDEKVDDEDFEVLSKNSHDFFNLTPIFKIFGIY